MRVWCLPLIVACNGRCQRAADPCDDADRRTWYADQDGDGHGDPSEASQACEQPRSTASVGDDCDDLDASRWEHATLWPDQDGDGFGAGSAVEVCASAADFSDQDGDCDDQDDARAPGLEPICGDGIDQDCDALPDCALPTGAAAVVEVAATRFYGEPGGALGSAVAGLGDLDGDGLEDVGLGAPLADPWGAAQVYLSPTEAIEDASSAELVLSAAETYPEEASIQLGSALAAADLTGDGQRDLVVGADASWSMYQGDSTYILPGPLVTGEIILNEDPSAIILAGTGGGAFLTDLDYVGSSDADLLVGAGFVALYQGPLTEGGSADELYDGVLEGTSYTNGTFGLAMAFGDLNADGQVDLLVGASQVEGEDPTGTLFGELGGAFLFTSTADLTREESYEARDDLAIYGATEGAQVGASVAFAGDPNGDGYDDLYLGAPGALDEDGAATGAVYVFDGATLAALDAESQIYADRASLTLYGGEADDELGASLLTGLQVEDQPALVVGAPGHDDETGAVALWYGQPEAGDTLYEADYRLSGTAEGDRFGATLANAGDTNGLGWDDLIIGAPGTSGGDGAGWLMVFDQL